MMMLRVLKQYMLEVVSRLVDDVVVVHLLRFGFALGGR